MGKVRRKRASGVQSLPERTITINITKPSNADDTPEKMYSGIEGGLGWWREDVVRTRSFALGRTGVHAGELHCRISCPPGVLVLPGPSRTGTRVDKVLPEGLQACTSHAAADAMIALRDKSLRSAVIAYAAGVPRKMSGSMPAFTGTTVNSSPTRMSVTPPPPVSSSLMRICFPRLRRTRAAACPKID